jgi:hypothetical protein
MNKKNFFIIITPIFFVVLLISVFYLLFFRDLNIENSNENLENQVLIGDNEENITKNQNIIENNQEKENNLEDGDSDFGLNIEVDGFKYCRYDEGCFSNLFLNCNIGNHINFVQEDLPYSFSILSKNDDYCFLLIQNLSNSDLEDINCSIPIDILNNENFNKILILDNKVLNSYCE